MQKYKLTDEELLEIWNQSPPHYIRGNNEGN